MVSNFSFDQPSKKISFNVTGEQGTAGFCNITMSKTFLGEPYIILKDGVLVTPTVTSNATHTSLYFTYTQSTHKIEIIGTTIVLEFPTVIATMSLLTVLALTLLLTKRRLTKTT